MIDCNAFLGHWAFRRLRRNDADSLVAMMDRFSLAGACVASADAILYRDCQSGNDRLYEETRAYEDRFWLYATLNPAYAGWERDLGRCVALGFKAVRMYPYYHGYDLTDGAAGRLADAAREAGLPISLPCRVVDRRQRHWMDTAEDLDPMAAVAFAEAHPGATFILTESFLSGPPEADHWRRMRGLDFYVEMSRSTALLDKPLDAMVKALGAERVLLGTGFPFKSPSPAFLKIKCLDAAPASKEQITSTNARRLFGAGG